MSEMNFENKLLELEKIIELLEKGECSLDQSIELFEKGIKITGECRKTLETAEKRIIELTNEKGEE